MVDLMKKTLVMSGSFNLGQLLQGENTPYALKVLADRVAEHGDQVLKFYLFSMVCIMSGLIGPKTLSGSLFMDNRNGSNIIWGIQCMQHLGSASPHAIYWSYISLRARALSLSVETTENLALA